VNLRALALGAFAVAIAAFAVVVPQARNRALASEADARQAASELHGVRVRLAGAERRSGVRALALEGGTPLGDEALTELRGEVVEALGGVDLSHVRLSVSSGRPPAAGTLSLQAEGSQVEVLRLLERLAHPTGSLVLTDVGMRPVADDRVGLSLSGFSLGGR
jgi:hypothetical protein